MSQADIDASLRDLVYYFRTYSLQTGLEQEPVLRALKLTHKRLFALLTWQIELGRTCPIDHMTWFNECVSDLVQCLPLFAQGFYKACIVLHRSSI